jgi:hypothetical protein
MRYRRAALAAGLAALAWAGSGCSTGTGITASPIEASISHSFTNLYLKQQQEMGNPVPTAASLQTRASCLKGTPAGPQSGAGADWTCDVTYLVDGPSTPVTAIYNLTVQTNGCYAADGDGPAALNGSRTITGPGYQQIHNPLFLIDGCFDLR